MRFSLYRLSGHTQFAWALLLTPFILAWKWLVIPCAILIANALYDIRDLDKE